MCVEPRYPPSDFFFSHLSCLLIEVKQIVADELERVKQIPELARFIKTEEQQQQATYTVRAGTAVAARLSSSLLVVSLVV